MLPIDDFKFGIEHEFWVIDREGMFCDFTNTTLEELDRVIERLPAIESGDYLRTDPKGFEIRTPICDSLDEAVSVLQADLDRWIEVAGPYGYRASHTALNPFQTEYIPIPDLNAWEETHRQSPEELTAHIHMLTYGPDVSFSHPALSTEQTVDIGMKLTHYSPYIVPFSFSSQFFTGRLGGGHSRRTYYRTGARPAALVFVEHDAERVPSFPTLTDKARLPAEVGRVEFKEFDCVADVECFRSLGTLLLGIALDATLPGRALVPDGGLHKLGNARVRGRRRPSGLVRGGRGRSIDNVPVSGTGYSMQLISQALASSRVICLISMACLGHIAAQTPHPLHRTATMWDFLRSSKNLTAFGSGQTCVQSLQPTHFFSSTYPA